MTHNTFCLCNCDKQQLLTSCSFITSSATSWTTSHLQATNVRFDILTVNKLYFPSVKSDSQSVSCLLILPSFLPGNLISHIFRENEVCRDAEWERYFCYKNIEVPDIYSGPHLTFPLTVEQAVMLVDAFRNKKVGEHTHTHTHTHTPVLTHCAHTPLTPAFRSGGFVSLQEN